MLHFEEKLGKDNATRLLSAYGIERGLDKNLFWTRLNTLAGDLTFSRMSPLTCTNTMFLFPTYLTLRLMLTSPSRIHAFPHKLLRPKAEEATAAELA